ncbi:hypothetical protein M422DRAFT_251824 [Sphaerobolus stellatus SS14]|uniref:Uncharacterized protein n=1 Tax=Sphaerobolus stellatus (strain SS14) TaxID=990650 RepID=A0A0C9W1J4_SPHS4|nr:hypothetical protein M422DRAFT_251824 [Sphaerobolus stellatus SS14]
MNILAIEEQAIMHWLREEKRMILDAFNRNIQNLALVYQILIHLQDLVHASLQWKRLLDPHGTKSSSWLNMQDFMTENGMPVIQDGTIAEDEPQDPVDEVVPKGDGDVGLGDVMEEDIDDDKSTTTEWSDGPDSIDDGEQEEILAELLERTVLDNASLSGHSNDDSSDNNDQPVYDVDVEVETFQFESSDDEWQMEDHTLYAFKDKQTTTMMA